MNYCGFNIEPYYSDVCVCHRCPQILVKICRNMGICCGFRAVPARERYPGFILLRSSTPRIYDYLSHKPLSKKNDGFSSMSQQVTYLNDKMIKINQSSLTKVHLISPEFSPERDELTSSKTDQHFPEYIKIYPPKTISNSYPRSKVFFARGQYTHDIMVIHNT